MSKLFLSLIILISLASLKAQTLKTSKLDSLQGKWQSKDDKQNVIVFKGNKRIEYYGKEKIFESEFAIGDICSNQMKKLPASKKGGKYLSFFESDDYMLCYEIEGLTNNSLTLFYIGSGKFLTYKRIE
jgi:hypothetical protein